MLRNNGQYDQAKRNYYAALHAKPKETNLYVGLAILYLIVKNYDSSGYCFRTALQLNPSAEAHGNYANFLKLTGRPDSAIAEYNVAISLSQEMYSLYLNRGILLKEQNHWDDALSDLNQALRLNPDLGEIYYERSFCYDHSGDKRRALADVEKAIALGFAKVKTDYYEGLKN